MPETWDDLEASYLIDPDRTTEKLIAEVAASAAVEVARINEMQTAETFKSVSAGLGEMTLRQAVGELEQKYGAEEFQRMQPRMNKRLARNPHLLPEGVMNSPAALARTLEDVYVLSKKEAEQEAADNYWASVQEVGAGGYRPVGYRGL